MLFDVLKKHILKTSPLNYLIKCTLSPLCFSPPSNYFFNFIYLFLERREGREKEREEDINVWLPLVPRTGDLI